MLWQSVLGAIGGFLYEICREEYDKEEIDKYKDKIKEKYKEICDFSVPPKAEPIKDLNDYQIRKILLNPKVKETIESIIKHQTGVVNTFNPDIYYKELDDKIKKEAFIDNDFLKPDSDKYLGIVEKETKKDDNSTLFKAYDRIMKSYRRAQDYHEGKLVQKIKPLSYKLTIEED